MIPVLRNDKTCLNCGTIVEDRYCPSCGQENVEIKESFGHLVRHFFDDFTHFDSKIVVTLKYLLFKPGLLTKEYLNGKRKNRLHPIRLYIFTSFLFFLVSLTYTNTDQRVEKAITHKAADDARQEIIDSLKLLESPGKNKSVNPKIKDSLITTIIANLQKKSNAGRIMGFVIVGNITYKRLLDYDSLQKSLPAYKRETGLTPWLYGRWLRSFNSYGPGIRERVEAKTQHFVPKMMFLFLPFFALLLKLFYDKKKYFYVDHAIFSLHFHSAVFLLFLISSILALLFPGLAPYFGILEILTAILYLFLALRCAYQQSFLVTLFKTISLSLIYSIFIFLGYGIIALSILL